MAVWTKHARDLTSVFRGYSIPLPDLHREIEQRGWQVLSIKVKNEGYVARVKNPHGEQIEKTGLNPETALAHALLAIVRREHIRTTAWKQLFTDKLPEIAQAYAKAPIFESKAAIGWKELADDSRQRANVLSNQLKVEITPHPVPYHNIDDLLKDVKEKGKLKVSAASTEHPLWSHEEVINHRIAHTVLGHAMAGSDYSWPGRNQAFAAHAPLLTPNAQKALFTEHIGRPAYEAYYPGYSPQKIAFLKDFIEPAQEQENPPGHMGYDPNYSLAPIQVPHTAGVQRDPNHGFDAGIDPEPNNAYLAWNDPLDTPGAFQNARKMDTGWSSFKDADGNPDYSRMKLAIVNAFRAALLSPMKTLKWNCHDVETEALTDKGWLRYEELKRLWESKEDFRVAAYRDGEIVYEIPDQFIDQNYVGSLIRFNGRYIDACVTPNHRMLFMDGSFRDAANVPTNYRGYGPYIPTSGIANSAYVETFTIPGCFKRQRWSEATSLTLRKYPEYKRKRHPDRQLPMNHWLRWLGWYISEGWLTNRDHPCVCQHVSSPVLSDLQEACKDLDIFGKTRNNGMWVAQVRAPWAKPLGRWLKVNVGSGARNKRIPKFIFTLPKDQIWILLRSLLYGDGTAKPNWDGESGVFYTSSYQLANDVQRLAVHCGFRATYSKYRESEWVVRINPGVPKRLPPSHQVNYNGPVWCFSMPCGTMVTRRNGKTLISGNSIHYQDISSIPPDVSDPKVYWDTLNKRRIEHNRSLGDPNAEVSYRAHWKELQRFYRYYSAMHPDMTPEEVKEGADREVLHMEREEEARLREKLGNKYDKEITEPQIFSALKKRLKVILDESSK